MNTYALLADISWGKMVVPALIVGLAVGFLFIMVVFAQRYKRIAPNKIGIIYGKRRTTTIGPDGVKTEVGFKLVSGGAVFIMPIFEQYSEMSTEAFQIEISEDNIPSAKNVAVTVSGVATCRISQDPTEQINAVQNFMGKPEGDMSGMIAQILRGHLRSIVGGLEIEQLLRDRTKFNERVVSECSPELSRMGIKILTLVIQDVRDKEGYIDALGKQAVAAAKRDAQIATAEAEKETAVKVSDAARTAAEVKAKNDAMIKDAEKNRDVQVAQFKLETATKQAEADMAGALAKTAQEKNLQVLEAQRDAAGVEARTKVQEMEVVRREKELQATLIVTAKAEADAMSITATGKRNAAQIDAETRKNVAILNAQTVNQDAEGKKNAAIQEGLGQAERTKIIAEASSEATRKTKTADADGEKAILLAKAEGDRAQLLAKAEGDKAARLAEAAGQEALLLAQSKGIQTKLLAEAEGADKMAEAMMKLSEQGRLILVLDRLPALLEKGGDAGQKIAEAIFGNLGKSMEKIGSITINDLGGGNGAKNGIAAVGDIIPGIVANFFAKAKMAGVDLTPLYKMLQMDPAKLASMVTPIAAAVAPATGPDVAGSPRTPALDTTAGT